MGRYKYYFELNRNGDPIEGSNIRTYRPPKSNYKRWKELITVAASCCDPDIELETSSGRKTRYYVRLDDKNLPVSGSLMKRTNKPTSFHWQEVVGHYCCDVAPTIEDIVIDTDDPTWSGNLLTLGNAIDPNGDTVILWTTGIITQDDMTLTVVDADGSVTIEQDDPVTNTTNTSVFDLVISDGHGNHTSFTVTVNYEEA